MDLGEVAFQIKVLGEAEARKAMEDHIRDQDRVVQAMDDTARAAMRAAEIRERAIQREMKAYDDQVRAVMQIQRAYEDLAASFDPLNKAQLQYQRGMDLLDKALQEKIINEQQYKRVLKDLETQMQATIAAEKLRESQVIANEEKRTAAALEATSRAYDRLVASMDPAAAAEARYADAQKVAQRALEEKVITTEQYNRTLDLAAIRRATDLTEAQTRAEREASRATRESVTEKSRLESELATFTATISQTERAQQMYSRAQDLTTRAVQQGIITQERANQVMAETQFRIQAMGHYVNDMGQVMSRSDSAWSRWARGGIQQAGYQVSDFFIQMQMGTPIATALGQQGSQLLGSFGQWGAVLGGLLAIGAAVYTIWSQMSGAAETLEDRINNLEKAAQSASESLDKLEQIKFDGMFDGIKVAAASIRTEFAQLLEMMETVERKNLEMQIKAMQTGTGLSDYLRSYQMRNSVLQQTGSGEAEFDFMGLTSEYQGRFTQRALSEIGGSDREEILKSVQATREKLELIGYLTPEVEQYLGKLTEELGLLDLINEKQTESNEKQRAHTELVNQTRSTMAELVREREAEAEMDVADQYTRALMIIQQYHNERIAGEQRVAAQANAIHAGMLAVQAGQLQASKAREAQIESQNNNARSQYYQSRIEGERMVAEAVQSYSDAVMSTQRAHATRIANEKEFVSLLEDANIKGRNFAGLDFSSPIAGGSREALVLAANLGIALGVAERLAALGPQGIPTDPSGKTYSGRGGVIPDTADIFSMGNGYITPPSDKKGGGGGGGSKQEDALEKLREQVKLETELLGKSEAYQRVINAIASDRARYSEAEINAVVAEIQALENKKNAIEQVNQVMSTVQSSLEDGFMAMMSGTKSVEEAFKEMAYNIIAELYRILVVQQIVGKWNAESGTGTGLVGFLGNLIGGFNANGGVFSPHGKVRAFANGGVVDGPTMFPMRGGTGIMGEAGPEAIMPLSKTPDGRLGVQVAGGGATGGDVHVHNSFSIGSTNAADVKQEITKMLPTITQAAVAGVMQARKRGGPMRDTFK
jgi:hypothetical protein